MRRRRVAAALMLALALIGTAEAVRLKGLAISDADRSVRLVARVRISWATLTMRVRCYRGWACLFRHMKGAALSSPDGSFVGQISNRHGRCGLIGLRSGGRLSGEYACTTNRGSDQGTFALTP